MAELVIGDEAFDVELLDAVAPRTVDAVRRVLPLESTALHVRWSGYAIWSDLDGVDLPVLPRENNTSYPSRGDVLLYPRYESGNRLQDHQELLIACGPTHFTSPTGPLDGNHFATVDATRDALLALEEGLLSDGAKPLTFEA